MKSIKRKLQLYKRELTRLKTKETAIKDALFMLDKIKKGSVEREAVVTDYNNRLDELRDKKINPLEQKIAFIER